MKTRPFPRRVSTLVCSLAIVFCSFVASIASASQQADLAKPTQSWSLPIAFEQNRGQADTQTRFLGRTTSGLVSFSDWGVRLGNSLRGESNGIQIRFLGANSTTPRAESPTGGIVNYYVDRQVSKGLTQIPLFGRIRYMEIYPGVDAVFHGNNSQLEYDFEIATGSSPSEITIKVDGIEKMEISANGSLKIAAGTQAWTLPQPSAFQVIRGEKHGVDVKYQITQAGEFKFLVGDYDRTAPLLIDPVVQYAGLIAVGSEISVAGIRADSVGNLWITGSAPPDYRVVNGNAGQSLFVTKLNPAGDTILFSTFIQASGGSTPTAVSMDSADNLYITGTAGGSAFPVTTSALGTSGGFLMKLAPNGSIVYSSLLTGANTPRGLAVDLTGNAYIVGTADTTFQTVNAFESTPQCASCQTPFFAKVNPSATAYVFSSYFYDPANPQAAAGAVPGIGVDSSGNLFLAGQNPAPQVNPWQSGGALFVAKFAPDGKTLLFSTDFGSGTETLAGMSVGTDGTIYMVGSTQNNDFPYTINAARHPDGAGANRHIFATAINPALNGLSYSTYIADGNVNSMYLAANNHLFVAGDLGGTFPLQNSVVSDVTTPESGFFVELDPLGQILKSSRFGGHFTLEIPTAIAADSTGNVYLSGEFSPQNGALDPVVIGPAFVTGQTGGNFGIFFSKISPVNAPQISLVHQIRPFLFLRNAGSADLHIASMTFSGGRTSGNCGTVVPAGGSCVVTVSDANGGLAPGTLTITSDAQPAIQTFTINLLPGDKIGTPIGDLLWFGDDRTFLPPRLQPQTVPFHIWNVGTASSVINLIEINSPASQTNDCGAGLAPGAGCTVTMNLPGGGSNLSVFSDNGFFNSFLFFSPVVTDNLLLSTTGISFQTQFVGGVAIPRTITITNTTESAAAFTPVLTGDSEFTIVGNTCPALLPAHQNCVVSVQFNPLIDGARQATLNIGSGTVQLSAFGQIISVVHVSPLQQDFFPTVIHLGSETFNVVLTNTLSTPAPIVSVAFSQPDYSETDDCVGQVPANGSCTLAIKFVPQAVGARNGTMTVTFSGAAAQVVTLTGHGITPFNIPPTTLNFTAVVGGTSAPSGFSVGNNLFTPEAYTFTLAGDFAFDQNPCPSPMPPNGGLGCFPTIVFQPKVPGSQHGTLTISYAGITEQDVVNLNGTVTTVSASPLALNFPLTNTQSSSTLDVTLTNSAAAAVAITSLAIGSPYSEADACQGQVPANGSCILHVTFTPKTVTFAVPGTLAITLADGSHYVVALSGIGTGPVITLAVNGNAFPDQVVGTSNKNIGAVTVINNGDSPLNIGSIAMSGADFIQTNNCPASLISSCQISVQFTPSATGLRTGALTLTDNGAGSPQTIQFSGTGTDFQMAASVPSVKVIAGQTATYNLSFTAVGSFDGQIQVACTGAPSQANCFLSSPNVNVIGNVPVPLIVTVATSPHTSAGMAPMQRYLAGLKISVVIAMLPFGFVSTKKLRTSTVARRLAMLGFLSAGLMIMTSCGGGGGSSPAPPVLTQGGTPAGTYTVSVTATDQTIHGPVTHQTNLTLVVQ